MHGSIDHLLFFVTGCGAGIINALAGGGPILTLGVLTLSGLDPRIANLTSTVALSPGQLLAGTMVRHRLSATRLGSRYVLVTLAIAGGAAGAGLLLATSSRLFDALVPWLVLAATALYAISGVATVDATRPAPVAGSRFALLFAPLTIYGGYFGGGNSFLVLALLGVSGHGAKLAGEIKNALVGAINLGAVAVFIVSGSVDWPVALSMGLGGLVGSYAGARLFGHLPAAIVRTIVVLGGLALATWMFAR